MTPFEQKKIHETLQRLNWNYGRGDVTDVDFENCVYTRTPFQCKPEQLKFRYENGTVYALGHQLKIFSTAEEQRYNKGWNNIAETILYWQGNCSPRSWATEISDFASQIISPYASGVVNCVTDYLAKGNTYRK